jgi:hypothetical protein
MCTAVLLVFVEGLIYDRGKLDEPVKFKTAGKLPIILEEFIEYTLV